MTGPKQVAATVAVLATQLGIEVTDIHRSVAQGDRSPREYLVEVRHGRNNGVVRVANFGVNHRYTLVTRQDVSLRGRMICDLYDGAGDSIQDGLRAAEAAVPDLARWAEVQPEHTASVLARHEARSRASSVGADTHIAHVACDVAEEAVGNPGGAGATLRRALDSGRRIRKDVLTAAVSRRVVDECGMDGVMGVGFDREFADLVSRECNRRLRKAVRDSVVIRFGVRDEERLRRETWGVLADRTLALRVRQGALLLDARGANGQDGMLFAEGYVVARVLSAVGVKTRRHLAVVALAHRRPGVEPWTWVSEAQRMACEMGSRMVAVPPDEALEPYRDVEELRAEIRASRRLDGTVLVPLSLPRCVPG